MTWAEWCKEKLAAADAASAGPLWSQADRMFLADARTSLPMALRRIIELQDALSEATNQIDELIDTEDLYDEWREKLRAILAQLRKVLNAPVEEP